MTGLPMTNCPSEENLAAFIDGRLDDPARRRVVEHMAQCAACRDVLVMADEIAMASVVPRGGEVVRGRFPNRMIAAAAMAAAISLVFLTPAVRESVFGESMGSLANKAQASYEIRPTQARLNSAFSFQARPNVMRGELAPVDERSPDVEIVKRRLEKREAEGRSLSVRSLHVLGVAELWQGEKADAIAHLEAAVKKTTGESDIGRAVNACDDVGLLSDLVNAYLAPATDQGDQSARVVAERAWSIEQSALTAWNRAVTLESLEPKKALEAWETYLALDGDSKWATVEVPARKERLVDRVTP